MPQTERIEERRAKEEYVRGLLDDVIDYDYHIRFWDFTPQGKLLLCRNSFTGNCVLKADGFNFINPIAKGRHIDIREGYRDLPKLTFETADRIQTTIDPAIGLKIIVVYDSNGNIDLEATLENILNLIKNTKNIYENIYFAISNDLMLLFKSLSLDDVIGLNIERDSEIDEIQKIYEKLDEVKKYGIEITQFKKKSVDYPEEVKRSRMQLEITNRQNEAILASAKAKKEKTIIQAEAIRIEADAKKYAMDQENAARVALFNSLKEQGLSDERAIEYMKTVEIRNSNARVTAILGDNTGLASAAAQLGTVYNQAKENIEEGNSKILTR